ncbi:bZIP transcription factor [Tissierella pigra]|uniref:Uncharacterized protein n=1 Tax=Tissierella pigra TaxID=2607614 RepID=A0A6N7XIM2_9FIRM|nr:bZIP transcription factor [Tissierella pigra]MSU01921.1 hypothetical protein [Tissierella pigra]
MSKVLHYYAKINENDVCYGFESLTKKFREDEKPSNLVYLPDYNESVLWRKWDTDLRAWSGETYEPSTDTILQDKVEQLEEENQQLSSQVNSLESTLQNVNATNETLVQSIAELTAMIATMQTP